jgi:hypothetical protein
MIPPCAVIDTTVCVKSYVRKGLCRKGGHEKHIPNVFVSSRKIRSKTDSARTTAWAAVSRTSASQSSSSSVKPASMSKWGNVFWM